MRVRWGLWGLAGSILSCRGGVASPIPEARADSVAPARSGVAVVELFTSEGCSSCPPADGVLDRIGREAHAAGRVVIPLAFHVDYWDGLGWPDRFSSPDFTSRQRDYAGAFGESGLYTPQMVVGGVDRFVGSDGAKADESVARALARPADVGVALRVVRDAPGSLSVHYDVTGPLPPRARVVIAVTERAAMVRVGAGENAGRTLRHTNIVRDLAEWPLRTASGEHPIHVSWTPGPDEADVAVLVQRTDGADAMAILGAAMSGVPAFHPGESAAK